MPPIPPRNAMFSGNPTGEGGGERGTVGSFVLLCELGKPLCQFPAWKIFGRQVQKEAASLSVPEMMQYYRKRIEASRYLNRYLNILNMLDSIFG